MMDDNKSCHKQYAATIKGVHSRLRMQLREAGGDVAHVWKEHCRNQKLLAEYADAMRKLATDVWTRKPETRIDWCRNSCRDYFLHGGLAKLRLKEARKLAYDTSLQTEPLFDHNDSEKSLLCQGSIKRISESDQKDSLLVNSEETPQGEVICLPFKGKISLLDVGSCYNPFSDFDEFMATGVDLCPAVESVHRCDFLELEVLRMRASESSKRDFLSSLKSPVTTLPEESFHVVVFSLLLEYLPSPQQRWICCQKAHQLLVIDGLLLIISPDSHHQQRNAPMIKSWKLAIESLGFTRWRYVKQEHLHCIAFRKTKLSKIDCDIPEAAPPMLYIPQDLHGNGEKERTKPAQSVHLDLENELDFLDIFSDMKFDD